MVAEASDGPAICRVGSRTLHQYWHLLAPCFRSVLLAPNRRVGEAGAYWTWLEPADRGPPGPVELARVRQRLADAFSLFFDTIDHDAPLNEESSVPLELRLAIEDVVTALQACNDARLAAYVCRTEAGWFVHSWGVTPAAVPRVLDELGGERSGSSEDAESGGAGRSSETKTDSRRRRRVLRLLLGLLLLGSATTAGVWWLPRRDSQERREAVGVPVVPAPELRARPTRVTRGPEPASEVRNTRASSVVDGASAAGNVPTKPEPRSAGWRERAFSPEPRVVSGRHLSPRPADQPEAPSLVRSAQWDTQPDSAAQRMPASTWSSPTAAEHRGGMPEPPGDVPHVAISGRLPGQPLPQVTASAGGRMPAANVVEAERNPDEQPRSSEQRLARPPPNATAGGGTGHSTEGGPPAAEASSVWPRAGLALSSPSAQVTMTGAGGSAGIPAGAPAGAAASQGETIAANGAGAPAVPAGSSLAPGGGSGGAVGSVGSAAGAHGSGALSSEAESPSSEEADVISASTEIEGRQRESGGTSNDATLPLRSAGEPLMNLPGAALAPPDSHPGLEDLSAAGGWTREIAVAASQLQLLRDMILPTEIELADQSSGESLAGLREQARQTRDAEMPATLRQPEVWWTCVIELPADAEAAWNPPAANDDAVRWTIGEARAELTWKSDALARPVRLELTTGSRGEDVLHLELHVGGRLRLQAGEPHRVWIAATVAEAPVDSMNESTRFRWREAMEPGASLPATRSPEGRHRLDMLSSENAAFEDRVTGWALLVDVRQIVHDRP